MKKIVLSLIITIISFLWLYQGAFALDIVSGATKIQSWNWFLTPFGSGYVWNSGAGGNNVSIVLNWSEIFHESWYGNPLGWVFCSSNNFGIDSEYVFCQIFTWSYSYYHQSLIIDTRSGVVSRFYGRHWYTLPVLNPSGFFTSEDRVFINNDLVNIFNGTNILTYRVSTSWSTILYTYLQTVAKPSSNFNLNDWNISWNWYFPGAPIPLYLTGSGGYNFFAYQGTDWKSYKVREDFASGQDFPITSAGTGLVLPLGKFLYNDFILARQTAGSGSLYVQNADTATPSWEMSTNNILKSFNTFENPKAYFTNSSGSVVKWDMNCITSGYDSCTLNGGVFKCANSAGTLSPGGELCGGIVDVWPPPTCSDGIQNQDELGVDIGGVCTSNVQVCWTGTYQDDTKTVYTPLVYPSGLTPLGANDQYKLYDNGWFAGLQRQYNSIKFDGYIYSPSSNINWPDNFGTGSVNKLWTSGSGTIYGGTGFLTNVYSVPSITITSDDVGSFSGTFDYLIFSGSSLDTFQVDYVLKSQQGFLWNNTIDWHEDYHMGDIITFGGKSVISVTLRMKYGGVYNVDSIQIGKIGIGYTDVYQCAEFTQAEIDSAGWTGALMPDNMREQASGSGGVNTINSDDYKYTNPFVSWLVTKVTGLFDKLGLTQLKQFFSIYVPPSPNLTLDGVPKITLNSGKIDLSKTSVTLKPFDSSYATAIGSNVFGSGFTTNGCDGTCSVTTASYLANCFIAFFCMALYLGFWAMMFGILGAIPLFISYSITGVIALLFPATGTIENTSGNVFTLFAGVAWWSFMAKIMISVWVVYACFLPILLVAKQWIMVSISLVLVSFGAWDKFQFYTNWTITSILLGVPIFAMYYIMQKHGKVS